MKTKHLLNGLAGLLLSTLSYVSVAQTNIPAGATEWYLGTLDNVPQYVLEMGKGPVVVVIHGGFGAEHSYLLDAFSHLSKNYRLVFYDQRGSLRSNRDQATISLTAFVDDLELLRKQLGAPKVVLLTHSMGSATAMAYLAKHPDKVQGLVLTAPVHAMPSKEKMLPYDAEVMSETDFQTLQQKVKALEQERENRTLAEIEKHHITPPPPTAEAFVNSPGVGLNEFRRWRIQFGAANLYHVERWPQVKGGQSFYSQAVANTMWSNPDTKKQWESFRPALENFPGPIHIIIGDHDYIDPEAFIWKKQITRLKNAELSLLPKAGHAYWIDQPELSKRALTKAIKRAITTHSKN